MKKTFLIFLACIMLFCSLEATAAGKNDQLLVIDNPTLISWSATFSTLQLLLQESGKPVDFCSDNGSIGYYERNVRTGAHGERVADGGAYSQDGNYILGMGAGVDREDLWYVTLTFGPQSDPDQCFNNTLCMLYAFDDLFSVFSGEDGDTSLITDVMELLVRTEETVGIQINQKVLMRKEIGNGQFIVGVDSLAFYEAFYAGSLTTYYNLDE